MGRAGLRRGAELVAAAMFAIMFGAFLVQIVSRYVFNHPVQWSLEVCSLAYIWIVFWSAALLVGERQHIAFDLIYKAARPGLRRGLALFITLSIGMVLAAGFPGSLDFVTFLRRTTLILHVPLYLAYSCFLVFMIAAIIGAAIRTRQLLGKDWRRSL
jgi:TRAP-type C4-dicarboxylate transport system permease small subunit